MTITLADLNQKNRAFWESIHQHVERTRFERPAIFEVALEDFQGELRKPFGSPTTFEKILLDLVPKYERFRPLYRKEFSQKGGKARKADVVSRNIDKIVSQRPGITCPELFSCLQNRQGIDFDLDLENEEFVLKSGKRVSFSALKDRLSRAKKKKKRQFRTTG